MFCITLAVILLVILYRVNIATFLIFFSFFLKLMENLGHYFVTCGLNCLLLIVKLLISRHSLFCTKLMFQQI